ncbi:hypothetical protein CASFOL_020147 [Castilleja foliolosa]|uniref:protein-serine/threonine phosphatase n=1 Tax=Castilleja foliolosa TaxID=1961234 RepID=A0ABD3D008_9LAMI
MDEHFENSSHSYTEDEQKPRRRRRSAILRLRSMAMALAPQKMLQLPYVGKGAFGSESGELAYGYISMVGRRRDMEDKVTVAPQEWLAGEYTFFAVYDGHGGAEVAEKCGERLHKCLEKRIEEEKAKEVAEGFDWGKVMMECFCSMDDEIEKLEGVNVINKEEKRVGSTAVVVLVGKEDVVVANCGDSRAVLHRSNDVVLPLSEDHKPEREDEKERIEAVGGKVLCWNGWRVEGVLATSRSLGDHYLKPYVTSEPEVNVLNRSDFDDFLIIGSDGLFDVMSNESACEVVKESLRCTERQGPKRGATEAAAMLAEHALHRGSKDNISVIVVKMA